MLQKFKHISVKPDVLEQLQKEGRFGESYSELVGRILAERRQKQQRGCLLMTFTSIGIDKRKQRSNSGIPILGSEAADDEYFSHRYGRLTPLYTPRTASAEDYRVVQREKELVKIISPDVVPNDDERNNKISYYAATSLPLEEIKFCYDKIRECWFAATVTTNTNYFLY
jgi:hypothetical protein